LVVTAPTGFSVSTSQSGTYSSSLSLTGPTITNSIIWVALNSGAVGSYSGTISFSSTNAGTQNVAVSGTISTSVIGTISGSTVVGTSTNTTVLTLSGYSGTIQWQSSTDNSTFTDILGATSATYTATNVGVTTYYRAVVTGTSCISNSNVATITFDNGCYTYDKNDFQLNGNATLLTGADAGQIRLTQAIGNQNGSTWNKYKVDLSHDFDIHTSVNLGSNDAGADGIAFVLQNKSVNAGSTGGGLGYMGIQPSFALEFDTYYNGGADPGSGSDHIALIKNGLAANIAAHSEFAPPHYEEMEDGLWHDVRIVWTAATHRYQVYWNTNNGGSSTVPLFDVTVDLVKDIFNNQTSVYFGLTAATGGAMNVQTVKVPNYCLVKQVLITPKEGYNNSTAATTICAPSTVVLEASPSSSYLWYKDGVAMPDSTAQSIIASVSGVYKVDGINAQSITTTSDNVTVTVNQNAASGTIAGGDVSVCASTNSTALTLSGYTGTIQWQSSTDNINFTNITGATSATYTVTNIAATKYYRAFVSSGSCSTATSSSVAITVSQCIVANPDINATMVNTPVNGNVSTNDKTTSGTTYGTPSASSSNPSGATITMKADGTYTFTATTPGRYIYYVPVCAAGQTTGCAVSTLEISVTDPNSTTNPPLAKNDYTTSQVNTPVNVKVLANDKVANPGTSLLPSSIKVATAPVNGTAAVNTTTGVITFTPNTGFTGTDSLNYNVCDNSNPSNCQVATVYFKISSSSVAEFTTADDDFNKVDMNTAATGNVLTNDVNSSNNTLTVTSYSAPLASQGTIVINADGSYTFTPTANYYGPVDITYTACTSGSVCATATLHILVSPVKPAAPKATNGTYTSKDPANPSTISPTVTNIPSGSKVIYCDVNGLSCATTAPVMPTKPGVYIWCVKSQDTITNLTSSPCVYDTITVLPYVKTLNATYINGVTTNPKNIAGLVSDISAGSIPKWCDVTGTTCTTTAPVLPTAVGRYIWCVKAVDTASGLVSATCKMDTVTILDPYTVMEISKTAKSVKLNPDGTILVTFVMNAINKTDASMDSVTIKDDLTATFKTSRGIVVYSLDTYGGLIKNVGYDGVSNIDLVANNSTIAAKHTDSLVLKVLLEAPEISGNLLNVANMGGKTKYGKLSVLSNDPLLNATDSTRRVPTGFVVPKVDVVIAGGFSPNQDGLNDKWIIIRPYGTTIHVKVFNRWGNQVYENENYNNDWDGRGQVNFIGQFLPEGTYFYMVEATDPNGNVQKFAKTLTIVR
jgi:gliding motility-associated-like protein